MGKVADTLDWDTEKTTVKANCYIDGTDHDTLLEALFDGAVAKADAYLNNPFEELRPTITLSSIVAGDYVTIGIGNLPELHGTEIPERYLVASRSGSLSACAGGLATYEAADELDEDEREFALGDNDAEAATNLAALINSTTLGGSYGAVGVDGVEATVGSGESTNVITLSRRYPGHGEIYVSSSDEDTMLIRQVRTAITLPAAVYHWVYQYIFRHFYNRAALIQDSTPGQGSKMYLSMKSEEAGLVDNYDLLRPWRLAPGAAG